MQRIIATSTLLYFHEVIQEKMPFFKLDLNRYVSTLIYALYSEEEKRESFQIINSLSMILRNPNQEINEKLLKELLSVKTKLPKAWKVVNESKLRIPISKREKLKKRDIIALLISFLSFIFGIWKLYQIKI
jgi:hypothetical protein